MLMKTVPLYRGDATHPQALACGRCEVRQSALFGALDVETLDRIHVHIAAPAVEADGLIYARGLRAAAVYTIRAGVVRFERATEAGTRRIVRLAGRGDLIGQEALLQQPYGDDAIACTPVELCRIPVSLVGDLGERERLLQTELMRRWQRALDEAEAWTSELCAGPARRRVLMLLRQLARHVDDMGRIWMPTRGVIGDMLDITEETASRIVSRLRREGVLVDQGLRHARLHTVRLAEALETA